MQKNYLVYRQMELVLSIKKKLDDLQSLQKFLDDEIRDNEVLGKQVLDLTKQFSTPREQDKYNLFVQDVDRIINLLLSLSGRLARVENTIQMLPVDADKQEMVSVVDVRGILKIAQCPCAFETCRLVVGFEKICSDWPRKLSWQLVIISRLSLGNCL